MATNPKLNELLGFYHPPVGDPWVVAFAINEVTDPPAKQAFNALLKAQREILSAQINFIAEVERIIAAQP